MFRGFEITSLLDGLHQPEYKVANSDIFATATHQQGGRTITLRQIKPIALPPPRRTLAGKRYNLLFSPDLAADSGPLIPLLIQTGGNPELPHPPHGIPFGTVAHVASGGGDRSGFEILIKTGR